MMKSLDYTELFILIYKDIKINNFYQIYMHIIDK